MARDKKAKKDHEGETGEEEVNTQREAAKTTQEPAVMNSTKKGKKGRKAVDWIDDAEISVSLESETASVNETHNSVGKRGKESKKAKDIENSGTGEQIKDKKMGKGKDIGDAKLSKSNKSSDANDLLESKSTKKKGKKAKLHESDYDEVDCAVPMEIESSKSNKSSDANDVLESKSTKKKGKKAKLHESDYDEVDCAIPMEIEFSKSNKSFDVNDVLESKSTKKKGRKAKLHESDDDEIHSAIPMEMESSKSNKSSDANDVLESKSTKKKGKKAKLHESDDDEVHSAISMEIESLGDDKVELTNGAKKKQKKGQKAAGFQLLSVEDDEDPKGTDNDSDVESSIKSESQNTSTNKAEPKGAKKSKKKERRKRADDDDEDISMLLEELALEMTGQKPVEEKQKEDVQAVPVEQGVADLDAKELKKKKKKEREDTQDDAKEALPLQPDSEKHTVKTAAEKRKEKKEKDKQKKVSQFESSKKSSGASQVKSSEDVPIKPSVEDVTIETQDEIKEEKEEKGKKKKKKETDEDKKDKKRPGKKQIAAMQEALKKVREEEERLRIEEEEKIKAAEEAERLRQEKLRLEQERKEKKKQKEKEKRERLKAEGKLLTKTQRQNRARLEATLAVLRQQGVEVPQIGEKKERAPRLGDRKKKVSKKKNENQDELEKDEVAEPPELSADSKDLSPDLEDENKKQGEDELPEEDDDDEEDNDVKDAWDDSSDEEQIKPSKAKVQLHNKRMSKGDSTEDSDTADSDESEESDSSEESSSESEEEERGRKKTEERIREKIMERIKKRREDAENQKNTSKLRSPIVCVLGHVDTGKTKILDKIRKTHVQDSEAGGITQQIGATMVPQEALQEQCKMAKGFSEMELQVPGLLIIDTPGHESFSNLRSRGSSLCDIAVLVVDIMHGLEPQTIESINLLKQKKTPFIVALNKVDRLYEWKSTKNKDIQDVIKSQARNTKMEFDGRTKEVILQFANEGLNAVLSYENKDPRSYISMVPTSALTGDGMGNLMALVVQLTQSMMAKRLAFSEELQATVLEVKAIPGLGTTVDVILVNGRLREGDTILLAGYEGPVVTQIRSLLMPQPLKELRVKSPYQEFKEIEAAQGVKITAKDLDKAIAGLQLLVAHQSDEVAVLKEEVADSFRDAMNCITLAERGVHVQASTLGSLEALLDFLSTSKIPYAGIRIGPVVKKDVIKASVMLEHDTHTEYAVILAFDVKIERDAQELADSLNVKIFQADIIYHLFDKFMAYRDELKNKKRDEFKSSAVFPCKLRILPQYIFNSRDPIVVGVVVEAGVVREGTPLSIPSKEFLDIGIVTTIEVNHKAMETARKGQEVCIKIEPLASETPKMYGRHFDHTDMLVSKITRQSIDVCKEYFRDDLAKTDWQLMVELKKVFQIL